MKSQSVLAGRRLEVANIFCSDISFAVQPFEGGETSFSPRSIRCSNSFTLPNFFLLIRHYHGSHTLV